MGFQKALSTIHTIQKKKENFKTHLTLTKKENLLFSGCENTVEKLANRSADAEYIGKAPSAKIPEQVIKRKTGEL